MLKRFKDFGRNLGLYLRTPEIIYSVVLIIGIPLLIVVNSIFLIDQFTRVVNQQAQDKAADTAQLLGRGFTGKDIPAIQSEIEDLVRRTDGYFQRLDYWVKASDKEEFGLLASSDKSQVGMAVKPQADSDPSDESDPRSFTRLNLTWAERRDIAVESVENDRPGYLVSVLIDEAADRQRQAVISAFVSNDLISNSLDDAYFRSASLLTITVIIVLVLLFLRSRIYRYTTLFRRLQEVDQMKDEFISIASHELRTPLTSIKGNLSMLLDEHDIDDHEKQRMLEQAEKSTEQLTSLVADLLDVSKLEQGRIQIRPEQVDIGEFIRPIVEELKVQAKSKKLSLSFAAPQQKLLVTADREKLRQILVNLVGNAIKYTPRGSINLGVETEHDMAAVYIRDTGVGMSPEDRTNLFKKFYRIRTDKTANITGTGLGLWITKSLVELMGGQIFVDSIEGSGTQVKFTLPKA